jgi:hypothetical protein
MTDGRRSRRFVACCCGPAATLLLASCAGNDDDTAGGLSLATATPTTTTETPAGESGEPSTVASSTPGTVTTDPTTTSTPPPLLTVTRSASPPNGRLEIELPADSWRGVMWFLDQRGQDGSWTQVFALNTNPEGAPNRILSLSDEPYAAPDRGAFGPGLDLLDIPDDIEDGTWRACPAGVELGCIRFEMTTGEEHPTLSVPADPYLADGRSYVATTERVDKEVVVEIEGPKVATIRRARIDSRDRGGWASTGSVHPVNHSRRFINFVFPSDRLTDRPSRLCLVDLPPDTACVLLPAR